MAHHKRRRAKSRRAGCLLCKPHKRNGNNEEKPAVARRLQESVRELLSSDENTVVGNS